MKWVQWDKTQFTHRTVRTAHLRVLMTVQNFSTQYGTEQFLPPDNHHSSDVVYWRIRGQVSLHQSQLVLGWVSMSGFNSWCGTFISISNQPPRSIQPGHPFMGRHNEHQTKGDDALRLGSKGRYGSCVGGRWNCAVPLLHTGHIWVL